MLSYATSPLRCPFFCTTTAVACGMLRAIAVRRVPRLTHGDLKSATGRTLTGFISTAMNAIRPEKSHESVCNHESFFNTILHRVDIFLWHLLLDPTLKLIPNNPGADVVAI